MPVEAYVFDAYGTLFDVHSAIAAAGGAFGADAPAASALWRQKQLEYTWTRSLLARAPLPDFEMLTAQSLDFVLKRYGQQGNIPLRDALLAAYRTLSAYPDVLPALTSLKAAGLRTAIFTNGTMLMVNDAIAAAGLGGVLDQVFTVEGQTSFKPAPAVYDVARSGLGLPAERIAFVSSNRWDVAAAANVGFQPIWCNRTGQPDEYLDLMPIVEIPDLSALPGP